MVKTSPSNARSVASISGWGVKILCHLWPKQQNIKKKKRRRRSNIVTNSIKTLKIVHIKKILKKKEEE